MTSGTLVLCQTTLGEHPIVNQEEWMGDNASDCGTGTQIVYVYIYIYIYTYLMEIADLIKCVYIYIYDRYMQ